MKPVTRVQEGRVTGTRYVPYKSQVITSTGLISIDSIIGGGICLGTIFLIEDDDSADYSNHFLKHFIAEGIVCGHSIFIAAEDQEIDEMIQHLPGISEIEDTSSVTPQGEMEIAWRYQNNPVVDSSPVGKSAPTIGHKFDLSKQFPKSAVQKGDINIWKTPGTVSDLISSISLMIEEKPGLESDGRSSQSNVLRVVIQNLGSILWSWDHKELPHFLYKLRSLLRRSNTVVMITCSTNLIKEPYILSRCEHLCDNIATLNTFDDSCSQVFSEYAGLIQFKKLSSQNTLSTHTLESSEWAFKVQRHQFCIEKFHLPPELETTAQREQDEGPQSDGGGDGVNFEF